MKKLLAIILISIFIIPAIPVQADSPNSVAIGTKFVISPTTTLTYKGKVASTSTSQNVIIESLNIGNKTLNNDNKIIQPQQEKELSQYEAEVSSLPKYCLDLKTPINPTWSYNAKNKTWIAGANLFTASIDQVNVLIRNNSKQLLLSSNFTLNGKKLTPASLYPVLLNSDPLNSNYSSNTMEWDYKIFKRHIRLIEGAVFQYLIFNENPHGTIDIGTPLADNGFLGLRTNQAWDSNNKAIIVANNKIVNKSEFDRTDIVYPVTIDPTSTFTSSSSDGLLASNDVVYNTAWTNTSGSIGDAGTTCALGQATYGIGMPYFIYRSALLFDTTSLSSSIGITGATLSLYGSADYTNDDFNIQVQSGSPTYPHDPLINTDYNKANYTDDGGTLTSIGWSSSSYNSFSLNATGYGWINKGGTTKFLLRSDKDIAGTIPTDYEFLYFYMYEKGTGYQPLLHVAFTSGTPIVASSTASNVATTTARLNANLDDDGGEACTINFGYGMSPVANYGDYDFFGTASGTWTSGSLPYLDVTSLTAFTPYYYRVQAVNSSNIVVGATEQTFTTSSGISDVTNLIGKASDTSIVLNWDATTGASSYMLRWSSTNYPATIADGASVTTSTITNKTYTHTGLTAGTNYYYSIWGISGGNHSTNPCSILITTSVSNSTNAGSLPNMNTPSGWLQSPNYLTMSNVPLFYDMLNNIADGIKMPRPTAWLVFGVLISVVLGIVVYIFAGQHIFAALATLTICLAFWWAVQIVSMWFPAFSLTITVGAVAIRRQF